MPRRSSTPTPSRRRRTTAVRVGRGRRRRRHCSRRSTASRSSGSWRRPRRGGPSATTPARLDHRPEASTAAGSCPPAYDRALRQRSRAGTRRPTGSFFGIGLGMVAPTILAHATDHVKERVPPEHVPRRHRRLPAVQRARRRLRPRRPADQGRARRRRVGHHRPEGVDLGRAVQRHRRDHLPHRPRPAQAQGPHRLRRRHAGARRRGAAAAPDDRRRRRSTRCSSTRCACPTTTASATSTRAGPSRSPR